MAPPPPTTHTERNRRGPALGGVFPPARVDMALKRREALRGEARPLPDGRNGRGAQAKGTHTEGKKKVQPSVS